MTVSGSYDWTLTRDQIIAAALRKLGVIRAGVTPSQEQITYGSEALNAMVKEWANDGVRLWTMVWMAEPLATASSEVDGTDSKIYTCILGHTSSTDTKPITGTNWNTFWTERGETGGTWQDATPYYSVGDGYFQVDTVAIEKAYLRYADTDYDLEIIGWNEYLGISDKGRTGRPTHVMIDKSIPMRAIFWPIPDHTGYIFNYLKTRKLYDFDDATNTGDFPERWILACVYGLASVLSTEYAVPAPLRAEIDQKALFYFSRARWGEREDTTNHFTTPAYRI